MKEWAKSFYQSREWRRKRKQIFNRAYGLCERCDNVGEIVHHKTYLTRRNIDDLDIALGDENLELLCRECHAIEHQGKPAIKDGLAFDEEGNIVCKQ